MSFDHSFIHIFIQLVCRLPVLSRLTYLAGGGQLMGGNTW
jgi:hypothetical protein